MTALVFTFSDKLNTIVDGITALNSLTEKELREHLPVLAEGILSIYNTVSSPEMKDSGGSNELTTLVISQMLDRVEVLLYSLMAASNKQGIIANMGIPLEAIDHVAERVYRACK